MARAAPPTTTELLRLVTALTARVDALESGGAAPRTRRAPKATTDDDPKPAPRKRGKGATTTTKGKRGGFWP